MCGDKTWPLAVGKTVSLLYWSIGVEGRRILNCKIPHIMIDKLSTADIWKVVEAAFICFRRSLLIVFLITKQRRGENIERFYGKLKELDKNCDFENKEETLILDVFITNLIDPEIQKELLKQTALEMVISMKLEMRNSRCETNPGQREGNSVSEQPPIIKLVILKPFPEAEKSTSTILLKLWWGLATQSL